VSAIPEIVENGLTGILVPPKEPRPLAAAMGLFSDASKREEFGSKGKERVELLFSSEKMVTDTESVYDAILSATCSAAIVGKGSQLIGSLEVHSNIDYQTVNGFGNEWERFDQSELPPVEANALFNAYFSIFPWKCLPEGAVGFDLGCGSGRWDKWIAPKVGRLHCIDASNAALTVAKKNLTALENCEFHLASVDNIPLNDNSMDFGLSLGVLHHIPNTAAGIRSCVMKLKSGAPFLLYLYYAFDNKPFWFQTLWRMTDLMRRFISRLPYPMRYWISQILAVFVYYPLARLSFLVEKLGLSVEVFPLSFYRRRSFYVMRTDALDRFGTRLERRFKASEIKKMMEDAGLDEIRISDSIPYWCAVGFKRK
jgi:ubiquinone/menaquinone biosynthesis C-methylase UbiE